MGVQERVDSRSPAQQEDQPGAWAAICAAAPGRRASQQLQCQSHLATKAAPATAGAPVRPGGWGLVGTCEVGRRGRAQKASDCIQCMSVRSGAISQKMACTCRLASHSSARLASWPATHTTLAVNGRAITAARQPASLLPCPETAHSTVQAQHATVQHTMQQLGRSSTAHIRSILQRSSSSCRRAVSCDRACHVPGLPSNLATCKRRSEPSVAICAQLLIGGWD